MITALGKLAKLGVALVDLNAKKDSTTKKPNPIMHNAKVLSFITIQIRIVTKTF